MVVAASVVVSMVSTVQYSAVQCSIEAHLGGGLHGEVVQVQVQLAVGDTALTTNCLRHQPHLSWGQGDVLFQLS